jgi:hypothetical protein
MSKQPLPSPRRFLNEENGELTLAVLNAIEINKMTSDMTPSEAAISPELN